MKVKIEVKPHKVLHAVGNRLELCFIFEQFDDFFPQVDLYVDAFDNVVKLVIFNDRVVVVFRVEQTIKKRSSLLKIIMLWNITHPLFFNHLHKIFAKYLKPFLAF